MAKSAGAPATRPHVGCIDLLAWAARKSLPDLAARHQAASPGDRARSHHQVPGDLKLEYGVLVPLLPVLDLTLLHNTGAAFSFLSDAGGWQRWFFTASRSG